MQQDLNIDEKNWRHPSNTAACSQANKPSNRRHTISYYTDSTSDSSEKCSKLKKKLKRRSMNDCTTRKVKVESFEENAVPDLPDKFAKSSFGHLSREELIQRVVQLEKEKRLSKQLGKKKIQVRKQKQTIQLESQSFLLLGLFFFFAIPNTDIFL
jgi:hypothetical protein